MFGEYNIESKEKITPPRTLTKEQKKANVGNEWLEFLKGDKSVGHKAVRTKRLNTRYVSRGQRGAVITEKDGETGVERSRKQRKVVISG